jgi:hypothetical protein
MGASSSPPAAAATVPVRRPDGARLNLAHVRAGHLRHALLTEDFSPLEPKVSELKLYAKASGKAVLAIDVSGGPDREELITYTR